MTTVTSAELFKLRTTRGPWVIAVVSVALAAAIVAMVVSLIGDPGQPPLEPGTLAGLARAPGRITGAAAFLLGLLLATAEYRHSTVLTTRLGHPRVPGLLAGKTAAAALAGAVLALVVETVMVVGGVVLLVSRDVAVQPWQHGLPGAVVAAVVVTALHAVAGVAIGELFRNPALAVGVAFGWAFVVEGILPVVLREPEMVRWLPTGAIRSALALGQPVTDGSLGPVAGLALLAAYAAGLWLAALARAQRTDP
jgi:ABC-2 type transport system permease protein